MSLHAWPLGLNVLVTRARERVAVLTSIPRSEYVSLPALPDAKDPNGRYYLYAYLHVAESLKNAWAVEEQEASRGEPAFVWVEESRMPSAAARALGESLLSAHGIGSVVYWGNEGFLLDAALPHPVRTDEVAAGVLKDFSRYTQTSELGPVPVGHSSGPRLEAATHLEPSSLPPPRLGNRRDLESIGGSASRGLEAPNLRFPCLDVDLSFRNLSRKAARIIMSTKSTETKTKTKSTETSSLERGEAMTGAEILVSCMEREGVELIFAYPGGASMPIHQALTKSDQIRTVLPRHEQGGSFAAEGYARATGKVGVCMATSGPGATNLVTAIADAFLDSTPMVTITGQVPQTMIGRGAFQETDFFGMTLPVVKHSYLVTDINEIPRIVKEAFYIANTGRPGPVVIDMPKDVQESRAQPVYPNEINLRGYDPTRALDEVALNEVIGLIKEAKRPMIYCGGGIISAEAAGELKEFVERTGIPVASTIMGVGSFPESHNLSLKWLGMHGTVYANNAVNEADLLLALGVRFDDRVTGKVSEFAKHGTIVHIDIDNSEINKNKDVKLPILANIKEALARLNELLEKGGSKARVSGHDQFLDWYEKIAGWKKDFPLGYQDPDPKLIPPQYPLEQLYDLTKGDLIVTTGVGQHQMWAGQYYHYDHPRRFITSAGLGSMGYGYPAALGAKLAFPDMEVVDIDGDGSFLMNIQELATAKVEKIAAKAIILNNQHLGMVVQWEDLKYESNRAHTYLGDPNAAEDNIYPDYVTMCAGFGVTCERVTEREEVRPAIERMLAADEAYVLDIMVPYTEHVLPMIPGGMSYKDIITERIAEDFKGNVPSAL